MKLQSLSLALASVLGAAAQSMDGLPSCATSCATDSLPESCSPIDAQCICSAGSFIQEVSCCVAKACSKEDQENALSYARKICHGAGVTDLPDHASCGGSSTDSGGSGSGASATASSASSESTGSSTSDSDSSESSSSGSESSSESSSSSSPSESSNAAAAVGQTKDTLAAVAGVAAFAILA